MTGSRGAVTRDADVRRLAVLDSLRLHQDLLGEASFESADAERRSV